ncbi:Acetyl esterase/lipase [Chitinophaga sp. YR573]|uniref:alpha/beta hydrolase n=1 Tax=Chitinophaga sp. YR573 TaxID=1881040 RepID=UPI0008B20DDC|nr:alpha/beta hydrolase [Chitinophaga sp. YR573]SEW36172.1 Acetyl esterase/lipase [Chitinophaga sp. YR573]
MSLRTMIPILLLSTLNVFSQHKTTLTYSDTLKMDVYSNQDIQVKQPCVLFVFGGGFFMGHRDADYYTDYFNKLAQHNYKVISIDYRLGLKDNNKKISPLNTKPLKDAIDLAVTDLYDATAYLIKNADKLGIDTSMMMLSGSSAGAITVLQADWEKRNHTTLTLQLPEDFQYKAVLSFAGAILSYKGKPSYKIPPAPTMLFHGTDDKVVTYNKIRLFNKGFFGSKALAKKFRQNKYPYYFQRVEGMGHEVAGSPMKENLDDILWFIDTYVYKKKQYLIEVDFNDLQRKRTFNMQPMR